MSWGTVVVVVACLAAAFTPEAPSAASHASAPASGITPKWPTCTTAQYAYQTFVLLTTPCFPPDLGNSAIYVDHNGGVPGTSLQGPSLVTAGQCPHSEGYGANAWCSEPFTLSLTVPGSGAVDSIGLTPAGGEVSGCTSGCSQESVAFAGRQSGVTGGWCYDGIMNVSPCVSTTSEQLLIHGVAGSYSTFFACGEATIGPDGSQHAFACKQIQIRYGTVLAHAAPATLRGTGVVVHTGEYIELRYSGTNWNPAAGPVTLAFGGQPAGEAQVGIQGTLDGTIKINYWPHRQSVPFKGNPVDGCAGTLQASQEGTVASAPYSAKAIGLIVFSLDPRIAQGQVYCRNENYGLLFGGGDIIALNYASNLLDVYQGPGHVLRSVGLPMPGRTLCYGSVRRNEHVVIEVKGTNVSATTSAGPCP
jgi:hypothetical protein